MGRVRSQATQQVALWILLWAYSGVPVSISHSGKVEMGSGLVNRLEGHPQVVEMI